MFWSPFTERNIFFVSGAWQDIPFRVFNSNYYHNMTALLGLVGVEFDSVDYSGSYTNTGSDVIFKYSNWHVGGLSLPYLRLQDLFSWDFVRVALDFLRFSTFAPRHLHAGKLENLTLGEYLTREGYSEVFARRVLLTALAVMCTCTFETMASFPADVVVFCLAVRSGSGIQRARGGNQIMAEKLAQLCEVRLNARVKAVSVAADGGSVVVQHEAREDERFDHVIFATQANHVLPLLQDATAEEREALTMFQYEASDVVVHTDPSVMPRERSAWSGVNFSSDTAQAMPSATIWLNRVSMEFMGFDENVFQTWNSKGKTIAAEAVIHTSHFERPVMSPQTLRAISLLAPLQGKRRVWFCGSYARRAMPLLENGVASAMEVATALGCEVPWSLPPRRARTLFSSRWMISTLTWGAFLAVAGPRLVSALKTHSLHL